MILKPDADRAMKEGEINYHGDHIIYTPIEHSIDFKARRIFGGKRTSYTYLF
jgi:hypothetical protein